MEQRKYISILGDDRSTFEGVTPKIGSFYSPSYVSYAGFATPEGTWWMQLIHRLGGQLLVNNSFAGSHISCAGNYAACLPGRIRSLATEAAAPDLRGGAALVIAALAARGRSRIADTGHIDRGYACFVQMLTELGAQIEREMPCGSTCEKKTPSKKQI